jgi:replicative DNA helicase
MMQADRIPPHNIAAEQCVIGSLLIDGSSITQVSGFLEPEHFYREGHRLCYEVCLDLFTKNEAINRVTVAQGLRAKDLLEEVGGRETLVACELATGTSLDIEIFALLV